MVKNGFNRYTKKGLGTVKVGKWWCKKCNETLEEDRSFWEDLKGEFFEVMAHLTNILKDHKVSFQGISDVFALVYHRSRETVRLQFTKNIDEIEIPAETNFFVIHYDEQYPRKGRCGSSSRNWLWKICRKLGEGLRENFQNHEKIGLCPYHARGILLARYVS